MLNSNSSFIISTCVSLIWFYFLQLHDLGQVGEVQITKDDTLLLKGRGNPADVSRRVSAIRDQIADSNSEYEKEKMQERLARLSAGVGVLKVSLDLQKSFYMFIFA